MFGTFFICAISYIQSMKETELKKIAEIFNAERERWFCWMPVLFATGIGIYFALPSEPSKWLTLGLIEFLLLAAFLCRHYPALLRLIGAAAIILAGFADIQLKTLYMEQKFSAPQSGEVYIRGQVMSHDTNYRGRQRVVLGNMENLEGDEIKGRYRLTLPPKEKYFTVGQCVELVAEVAPVMKANLVGGYQPDRRLFYDGINGSGYVWSGVFEIDCPQAPSWLTRQIDLWRQKVTEKISAQLPPEQASVAAAIITGNRDLMTIMQAFRYRDSGLAHFLSISGLHMSMIAGLMFFAVRLLMALIPPFGLRYNSKRAAAVLALLISTVYLMISGGAVPTQRAYIMLFTVLLAVWFERQAISMRVLALAAMIILFFSPQMLVNISFQLSFAAVVGLIAFYERFGGNLERYLYGNGNNLILRIGRAIIAYLAGIVIADFVASLATLPFAIYHFNRIAAYTSLANLAAGPIIALIIMPAVLLALLTLPFGLSWLPLQIVGYGTEAVNIITEYISQLPQSVIEVYSFPMWGLLLITCGGLWLCLWQKSWRHLGWVLIVVGSLSLLTVKVPDIIAGDGGKAVAVRDESGKLRLLPGGNRWMKMNWAEKFASPYFSKSEDMTRPDLSHIDFDEAVGVSIYGDKILTVRDFIGRRPWNKN